MSDNKEKSGPPPEVYPGYQQVPTAPYPSAPYPSAPGQGGQPQPGAGGWGAPVQVEGQSGPPQYPVTPGQPGQNMYPATTQPGSNMYPATGQPGPNMYPPTGPNMYPPTGPGGQAIAMQPVPGGLTLFNFFYFSKLLKI